MPVHANAHAARAAAAAAAKPPTRSPPPSPLLPPPSAATAAKPAKPPRPPRGRSWQTEAERLDVRRENAELRTMLHECLLELAIEKKDPLQAMKLSFSMCLDNARNGDAGTKMNLFP